MEFKHINGAAARVDFTDNFDVKCSLQESAGSETPHLWVGINRPQVVASGGQYSASGRMMLSQNQVRDLLPWLSNFAESGALEYAGMYRKEGSQLVEACTEHPQWSAWLTWYMKHYTTHVSLFNGEPANGDTQLSWETWKAAHQTVMWKPMGVQQPVDHTSIVWRTPGKPGLGVGWYVVDDKQEWGAEIEWLSFDELNQLAVQK
jgi:hypothetical protein